MNATPLGLHAVTICTGFQKAEVSFSVEPDCECHSTSVSGLCSAKIAGRCEIAESRWRKQEHFSPASISPRFPSLAASFPFAPNASCACERDWLGKATRPTSVFPRVLMSAANEMLVNGDVCFLFWVISLPYLFWWPNVLYIGVRALSVLAPRFSSILLRFSSRHLYIP